MVTIQHDFFTRIFKILDKQFTVFTFLFSKPDYDTHSYVSVSKNFLNDFYVKFTTATTEHAFVDYSLCTFSFVLYKLVQDAPFKVAVQITC